MDKILGLGTAGCNIASCFEKYPQYTVRKIDCEKKQEDNYISILEQESAEYYELFCPDLKYELGALEGDLLFIVCGAATISGCALKRDPLQRSSVPRTSWARHHDERWATIGWCTHTARAG